MKRLALALAASILGSGCIVTTDHCDRSVTIDWDFLHLVGNQYLVDGCGGAGVESVEVLVNDVSAGTFSCFSGGATITGVGSGSNLFTVEGLDGTGEILYRDEFNVDSSACGDELVHAQPAEGFVTLNYQNWSSCGSATCYVWFSVHDDIANRTAAVLDGASLDPRTYLYPERPSFLLPVGSYSIDFLQLVAPPPPPTYSEVAKVCGFPTFAIAAATTTTVPLSLLATGAFCPP